MQRRRRRIYNPSGGVSSTVFTTAAELKWILHEHQSIEEIFNLDCLKKRRGARLFVFGMQITPTHTNLLFVTFILLRNLFGSTKNKFTGTLNVLLHFWGNNPVQPFFSLKYPFNGFYLPTTVGKNKPFFLQPGNLSRFSFFKFAITNNWNLFLNAIVWYYQFCHFDTPWLHY